MKTLKWTGLLAFMILLSGCQVIGPDDGQGSDLDTNRDTWESFSDGTYSFVLMRGCFCIHGGLHWVQVVEGDVVEAISLDQNEPVPPSDLDIIESIDDIFDMIERAEREADELEVEYADDGYPTRVTIDWIKRAVDDEMHLEVSEVVFGVQEVD